MEDMRAVLEAVGSQRAALIASQEGCWMAALFAATYPEASHSVVLFHPWLGGPDHRLMDVGEDDDALRAVLDEWGTRKFSDEMLEGSPTLEADDDFRAWHVI